MQIHELHGTSPQAAAFAVVVVLVLIVFATTIITITDVREGVAHGARPVNFGRQRSPALQEHLSIDSTRGGKDEIDHKNSTHRSLNVLCLSIVRYTNLTIR